MTADEAREELTARAAEEPVEATAVADHPDPEDFKPAGGELVVSAPEEVFSVLDRHDEAQILEEMQRRVLDVTLYDFPGEGGKRNVDLSFKGVREVIHLMNRTGKCRVGVVKGSLHLTEIVENGEPHYRAETWGEDKVTGEAYVGISTQPKLMRLSVSTAKKWRDKGREVPEDRKVWDPFAQTKAVNKSQRNALDMFIPEQIRQTLIAQYLNDPARVETIKAGAGAAVEAELPPPLATPEAEERKARARAVYDEIREASPLALLPGVFHQRFIRAASSLETLDSFIEALEQKRDELKAAA